MVEHLLAKQEAGFRLPLAAQFSVSYETLVPRGNNAHSELLLEATKEYRSTDGRVGTRKMHERYKHVHFFVMKFTELQHWVAEDWEKRSHTSPTLAQQLLYVLEELGEVAEAIRKADGNKERTDKTVDVGAEMADLLVSLTTLANTLDIDLARSWRYFSKGSLSAMTRATSGIILIPSSTELKTTS